MCRKEREPYMTGTETKDHLREQDWLWLCGIPGLYWKQRMTLLHYFGSPGEIRSAPQSEFDLWKRIGLDWTEKLSAAFKEDYMLRMTEQMKARGVRFVSCEHPDFPRKLKSLPDCPHGLYYKGELPRPGEGLFVGIVGARACSAYGEEMASMLSTALVRAGVRIVSGMACGIDGIAQRAALRPGGRTFAVLGCGPELCYPRSNLELYLKIKENGGILSEFPCGTQALAIHFPMRNRIISGLCDALVVVEARKKSGSLITADFAMEQGREVYALPGRTADPLSYGCNHLIEQGAGIILSADHLLEQLAFRFPEEFGTGEKQGKKRRKKTGAFLKLSEEERSVYDILDQTPRGVEELAERTGFPPGKLHSILLALQMDQLLHEVGKGRYVKAVM